MHIIEYRKFSNYIKTKGNFNVGKLIESNQNENMITLVSHQTPCEIKLPKNIEIIYNWNDLNEYEECNLEVSSIKLSGRKYYQTKLGHSCEIHVKYDKWYDLLNLSVNCDKFDLVIGFCEKIDWPLIKENLITLREEGIEE